MSLSLNGRRLGKYEIIQALGYGGMATVYKGYDSENDRYVAIKVLPPHPGRDFTYIERFQLEARTIARLQHPHILVLYDYGIEEDILYLAIPYIAGGSLRDLLNAGRLALSQADMLLQQIASALDYAHLEGVIHRDIKPGNILLDGNGKAFLADFGIAKLADGSTDLTGTGSIIGTPAYIAPEQSQSRPIDGRADIYSLGVVVYEMLVGRTPYFSANVMQLIMQHINSPIPSIVLEQDDLPAGLEPVMQRVMAKTPEERYQTALEFYEAFHQAVYADGPSAEQLAAPPYAPQSRPTDPTQPAYSQDTLNFREPIHTFLFTDIEGGTRLWEHHSQEMSLAVIHYNRVVTAAIYLHRGRVFKMIGDGFCAVFESASEALTATLEIARGLSREHQASESLLRLRVRMGLHTGTAEERRKDYFGPTINRVSRLIGAANGGQILLSSITYQNIQAALPDGVEIRDLGLHRLRDIREPEHLYHLIPLETEISFAAVKTLSPRPTNLPASLSSFVGREREKREIARLIRRPSTRLLTLTGSGGIGKTRLSIEVGSDLRDDYEDGVFFVDLSPLSQATAVIEAIATMLGVEESTGTDLIETLKTHLHERRMLLILDNFEHVLDAASFINPLLAATEYLKILVTSREPLRIYGEQLYPLLPLTLPAADSSLEQLMQFPAVRLFVERVQAAQPDFKLDDIVAPQVRLVCQHLDGLPLALELAAARIFDLSLDEIVEGLSTRLTLLNQGPRDVSSRQQTLRGAIDWSYVKLPPAEQKAFAQLSVFAGRFTAEEANRLIPDAPLIDLTRKSLLHHISGKDNMPMFVMLETLQEYAHEQLVAQGELDSIHNKHAHYYRDLVETAEPHLTRAQQIEWFRRLDTALYNLLAALEWSFDHDFETAGRIAAVLWRYWTTHSRLNEGTRWITRILTRAESLPVLLRARLHYGAGRLAFLQHNYPRARTVLQAGLTFYQEEKHVQGQADILLTLGETALQQNDLTGAAQYFLASETFYRSIHDEAGIARCLDCRGRLETHAGNFAAAEPLIRESLTLVRVNGSLESQAGVLNNLAEVLRAQKKYAQAAELYRESLDICRQLEFDIGIAVMLHNLGQVQLPQGNHHEARSLFLEALSLLKDTEERLLIAECFSGLAGALLHAGEVSRAVQYLSATKALLNELDSRLEYADQESYDTHLAETQARLDTAVWQAAWDEGQDNPLEHLLADALRGFSKEAGA